MLSFPLHCSTIKLLIKKDEWDEKVPDFSVFFNQFLKMFHVHLSKCYSKFVQFQMEKTTHILPFYS